MIAHCYSFHKRNWTFIAIIVSNGIQKWRLPARRCLTVCLQMIIHNTNNNNVHESCSSSSDMSLSRIEFIFTPNHIIKMIPLSYFRYVDMLRWLPLAFVPSLKLLYDTINFPVVYIAIIIIRRAHRKQAANTKFIRRRCFYKTLCGISLQKNSFAYALRQLTEYWIFGE